MAFVYMHIFSLRFLSFDMSLLLLSVTLRGVSNKHCLLSLFFIVFVYAKIRFSHEAAHLFCNCLKIS